MMHIDKIVTTPIAENTYVLSIGNDAIMIDPGSDEPTDIKAIRAALAGKNLLAIWCTHGHWDHIRALHLFEDTPMYMHELDAQLLPLQAHYLKAMMGFNITLPVSPLKDIGDTLEAGPFKASVMHLPGHSPGSCVFWFKEQNVLISGDVLFQGTYGRTDLPGGNDAVMKESLRKLRELPDNLKVYPGHGENTILKDEKDWLSRI